MTNEEYVKMRRACIGAGLSNTDSIRLRTALETGSEELLKSVLDGHSTKTLREIQATELKAAQAKASGIDELANLARTAAAAMADPAHPDNAPLLDRSELEEVWSANNREAPALSEEQLKQLEEMTAQAMTLPGSDWRNYLD